MGGLANVGLVRPSRGSGEPWLHLRLALSALR